jgi:hypothetical protein
MFKRLIIAAIIGALCGAPVQASLLLTGVGGSGATAAQVSNFLTQSYTGSCTTFAGCYTFSRAGNAMVYDSTGTLTYAPNNQLLNSATLSTQSITTTPSNYVLSIYGTGSVVLSGTKVATLSGTGASNQVYLAFTATAGTLTLTVAGSVTSAVLANVTYETAPRPGDQVITTSAAYYGPRFDYPNSTAAGLLHESVAATNVVLYSNDLTNTAWAKSNITAALNQTGADGVANGASSITATSANGAVLQSITLGSSARAQSALVKRITGTGAVYMTTDGGTTWTAITITGSWALQTIPIQTLANPSVGFKLATNGDAIAVQYVQNETTQQSSPIPTTTASATRAAESLTATPAALGWSDTTGTLIVEGTFDPVVENGIIASIQGVNLLELQRGNTSVGVPGQYAGQFASAGGGWTYDAATNLTNGSPARMGVQIISAVPYLSANGDALVNGGSISFLASTVIGFGDRGPGSFPLNYHLRSLGVYSAAMSSTVFRAKTTVGASY